MRRYLDPKKPTRKNFSAGIWKTRLIQYPTKTCRGNEMGKPPPDHSLDQNLYDSNIRLQSARQFCVFVTFFGARFFLRDPNSKVVLCDLQSTRGIKKRSRLESMALFLWEWLLVFSRKKTNLQPNRSSVKKHLGVSKNRGTPKWMVYNGKPY